MKIQKPLQPVSGEIMEAGAPTAPVTLQGDHRESSDTYLGELFRHGDYRVAECKDGIQFLVQHRTRAGSPDGARWESIAYCTTRKALAQRYRACIGRDVAEIAALPEHFSRGQAR